MTPAPPRSDPPQVDLDDPAAIAAWERSEWNVLGCRMGVCIAGGKVREVGTAYVAYVIE